MSCPACWHRTRYSDLSALKIDCGEFSPPKNARSPSKTKLPRT